MLKYITKRSIVIGLIQIIILVVLFYGIRTYQLREAIRGQAPMIVGEFIDGEKLNLSEYQGKPVLIHFWATWCPICKFSISSIDSISKDMPVITIASWSEGEKNIIQFLKEEDINIPVLVDDDGEWARLYGIKGVPTNFILDEKGQIEFIETGYTSEIGLRLRMWWAGK